MKYLITKTAYEHIEKGKLIGKTWNKKKNNNNLKYIVGDKKQDFSEPIYTDYFEKKFNYFQKTNTYEDFNVYVSTFGNNENLEKKMTYVKKSGAIIGLFVTDLKKKLFSCKIN